MLMSMLIGMRRKKKVTGNHVHMPIRSIGSQVGRRGIACSGLLVMVLAMVSASASATTDSTSVDVVDVDNSGTVHVQSELGHANGGDDSHEKNDRRLDAAPSVDCVMSAWGPWIPLTTGCTKSCGGGIRQRERFVVTKVHCHISGASCMHTLILMLFYYFNFLLFSSRKMEVLHVLKTIFKKRYV